MIILKIIAFPILLILGALLLTSSYLFVNMGVKVFKEGGYLYGPTLIGVGVMLVYLLFDVLLK